MADNKWLQRRRQTWYVSVEVPPSLRQSLGRRIVRTLGTRDVHIARSKRHAALAAIHALIDAARRNQTGDPVMEEAMIRRATFEAAQRGDTIVRANFPPGETQIDFLREEIRERAEGLMDGPGGVSEANAFYGLATGSATPLRHHVEDWLSEGGKNGPLKDKTKLEHRHAISLLSGWLGKERLGETVEVVTRRVAGRFVSERLLPSGRHPRTIAKTIRTLSGYWGWLQKRGVIEDDGRRSPWAGQAPSQHSVVGHSEAEKERPFTDDEVCLLLKAPPSVTLDDFMRLALLSGMRREEIGQLRVGDCEDGMFSVRAGKTAAARRRVPIHSDLVAIVQRLSGSKAHDEYLFGDIGNRATERTDPIGKAFAYYRKRLGIQHGNGRRSLVNFHSFRRWFATKARNAGGELVTINAVFGHKGGSLVDDVYSGGPTDAMRRACVEAVRLPT